MNTSPADFLDLLIGQWDLTGQMGNTPLHQTVSAKWILNHHFVELHITSTISTPESQPPYQATYFIGYDEKNNNYVMHLLDTSGASYSRVIGLGKQDGNTIPFVFQYKEGPFVNRFIWEADTQSWTFKLSHEQDGQIHVFATKRMTRKQ